MRRSQRLIKYKDVADKPNCFDESSKLLADDRNFKQQIQILGAKADNGSNCNESLSQLFKKISEDQGTGHNKNTLFNTSKTNAEVQEVNTSTNNTSKENNLKYIKRASNKQGLTATSAAPTTRRGRKRGYSRSKNVRQHKKSRFEASNEDEVKTPIISIDNYFNPIRNPLLQVAANAQPRQNNDFYCYHKNSLLPPVYPNHFVNQNHTNTLINPQQLQSFAAMESDVQPEIHFPTPELTQSLDLDSSTSTISLPESLRELFGCDDIRDVLKLEKVVFRMRLLHLQTLAYVLNIEFNYLRDLVEKIMKLDTETLQKVIFAFQPEAHFKYNTEINE
ncbi:ras guanine nucleotide exchange factor E-like [Bactrocera neohumeralis]|uniref:ras guanine nucleotide exchange factor E-like n=1 Tax=Bactrocera neohumeralis TaxID=98809 RepID=UPI0021650933|nr:ras guanine nucleotide exchange factor E-like [Bactrocera neohumeralis]